MNWVLTVCITTELQLKETASSDVQKHLASQQYLHSESKSYYSLIILWLKIMSDALDLNQVFFPKLSDALRQCSQILHFPYRREELVFENSGTLATQRWISNIQVSVMVGLSSKNFKNQKYQRKINFEHLPILVSFITVRSPNHKLTGFYLILQHKATAVKISDHLKSQKNFEFLIN